MKIKALCLLAFITTMLSSCQVVPAPQRGYGPPQQGYAPMGFQPPHLGFGPQRGVRHQGKRSGISGHYVQRRTSEGVAKGEPVWVPIGQDLQGQLEPGLKQNMLPVKKVDGNAFDRFLETQGQGMGDLPQESPFP